MRIEMVCVLLAWQNTYLCRLQVFNVSAPAWTPSTSAPEWTPSAAAPAWSPPEVPQWSDGSSQHAVTGDDEPVGWFGGNQQELTADEALFLAEQGVKDPRSDSYWDDFATDIIPEGDVPVDDAMTAIIENMERKLQMGEPLNDEELRILNEGV